MEIRLWHILVLALVLWPVLKLIDLGVAHFLPGAAAVFEIGAPKTGSYSTKAAA